jgi:hypothetical protein
MNEKRINSTLKYKNLNKTKIVDLISGVILPNMCNIKLEY